MAHILFIDDSRSAREFVLQALQEEHRVKVSERWSEIVNVHEIDLILLDANMPDLSGEEVAGLLQRVLRSEEYRIVLYSVAEEAELQRIVQEVGALGYIRKTSDPSHLLAEVRRFLSLPSP